MGERKTYFEWVATGGGILDWSSMNTFTGQNVFWTCPYPSAEIKNVSFTFADGDGGWILVRMLLNGAVISPDGEGGFKTLGYTADGPEHVPLFLNKPIGLSDRVGFQFITLDGLNHNFGIKMEVEQTSEIDAKFAKRKLPSVPGAEHKDRVDAKLPPTDTRKWRR